MYKLNKLLDHNYNTEIALHIFDHTVNPILLYGSEVWGIELTRAPFKITLENTWKITKYPKQNSNSIEGYSEYAGIHP